jgi:hypothetical protein
MSGPSKPKPYICPTCRSSNVSASSKIDAHSAHHMTHVVHGIPGLLAAGALWLAAKGMNSATHDWKCGSCGHGFSNQISGCRRCTTTGAVRKQLVCCGNWICESCLAEWTGSRTSCEFCSKGF